MSDGESTQSLDTKFNYIESADPVNSPAHYNRKGVEAIQAIEAKYVTRRIPWLLEG